MDKSKSTNVFQITDTHLFKNDQHEMFGVNTNKNFYSTLKKIHQSKEFNPDLFILTGDLSQDESEESYQKISDAMNEFGKKVYWIPGNHDNIATMHKIFDKNPLFAYVNNVSLNDWELVFLNTKIDGHDKGFISETELINLENTLASLKKNKPIAIIMHHHPIEVNTPLIDQYILMNAHNFWEIIDKNTDVNLIICGHVHGDYSIKRKNVHIETAPATCLQWVKGTKELRTINSIGFKIYQFFKNTYKQSAQLWSLE